MHGRVGRRLDGRRHDGAGGGEVGLARSVTDDLMAGGPQGLGLRGDGHGGRFGHRFDSLRYSCHYVLRIGSWDGTIDMTTDISIRIPAHLLPEDGRFGCGPTRVRQGALDSLAAAGTSYMGTSHRRPTVRRMVGRVREGLTDLFGLADGYEVVLGNGGATAFWDAAAFGLIERTSQHLSFGEFSSKFARAVTGAPHLNAPEVIAAVPGTHPQPAPSDRIDFYALTHNETSTGVTMPLRRVKGPGLTVVDATSGRRRDTGRARSIRCLLLLSPEGLRWGWRPLCSPVLS